MAWSMARLRSALVSGATVAVLLAGCGQVGSSTNNLFGPGGAREALTAADATRLAKQASFGPTPALVDRIQAAKLSGWLEEQFAATGSTYADLMQRTGAVNRCSALTGQDATNCNRDYRSATPVQMRFYADAMAQPDQLRQRVAYALSQLLVASDLEVNSTAGTATLQQILLDNAFGNYRDILKAVTLNPYMGDYLDMANSSKTAPNENYARELMQLFAMGVDRLNMDGTPVRDAQGAVLANYTPDDVKGVARALTGWTYARLNGSPLTNNNDLDYSKPMVVNTAIYDTTAKSFLGASVAANATPDASVEAVVTAVFQNASTAPYVSRHLIQQLVTSNPSPAYVGRVAAVFANNGAGVRGDLKAVVRAILTDAEARGDFKAGASDGKVKEPTLLLTSLGRLLGFRSDGYAFLTRDSGLGQQPFKAPSVFNFYPPDYPLAQSANALLSPQGKLITTGTVLGRHNLVYDWTVSGDTRTEYAAQTVIPGATGTTADWGPWEAFGTDTEGLLDRIDLLMLNRTMTAAQRNALRSAVTAVTNTNAALQARKRAQVALYVVASAPQFQTDR